MNFKEFIKDFGTKAEYLIAKYEQFKELDGEQKKERVDEALLEWGLKTLDALPINPFFKFGIRFILNNYLDDLTQVIFNSIQVRIVGITK